MTNTKFPRQHIAEQLSDLRQMRGAMADLISTACGLLSQAQAAEVPETVRLELLAALSHAEKADHIAKEKMVELYGVKTPKGANDDTDEAA
ncbi:hypothetical protein NKY66_10940 [Sinorhizobium meliloti]|uniref:hypothetical protein n=1 Tax=Rhizobium meliloti TaxID=382 RepID=UPI003D654FF0